MCCRGHVGKGAVPAGGDEPLGRKREAIRCQSHGRDKVEGRDDRGRGDGADGKD